jgi:hypothetical protein
MCGEIFAQKTLKIDFTYDYRVYKRVFLAQFATL